jgi:hypothetical protein
MRGTGSHEVTVSDVFVPDEHTMSLHAPPVENGPLLSQAPLMMLDERYEQPESPVQKSPWGQRRCPKVLIYVTTARRFLGTPHHIYHSEVQQAIPA